MRSAAVVLAALAVAVAQAGLVDLVDTRIGTGGVGFGIGSINPGPQVPFGSMRLGPDTSVGPSACPCSPSAATHPLEAHVVFEFLGVPLPASAPPDARSWRAREG